VPSLKNVQVPSESLISVSWISAALEIGRTQKRRRAMTSWPISMTRTGLDIDDVIVIRS